METEDVLHLIGSIDPRTNFSSALQNEDERFDSNFFLSARFFSFLLLLLLLYLLDSVFVTLLRQFCRAYNSLTKFFFWKRKRLFLIRYIYTHEGHRNIFISQRLRISGEEDFLLHAHTPSRPRARYLARRSSKERKKGRKLSFQPSFLPLSFEKMSNYSTGKGWWDWKIRRKIAIQKLERFLSRLRAFVYLCTRHGGF